MDQLRASRLTEPEAAGTRRLTFLGTGTSTGVPMIGCDCSVCTSSDPRNQRTRPSVLLSFPAGNLLIDTTPEMRMQLLRERVRHVHAIAFTHSHADHLFGLDDARLFPRWIGGPVPVYCEPDDRGNDPPGIQLRIPARHRRMARGVCPQAEFSSRSSREFHSRSWARPFCRSGSSTVHSRSWVFAWARMAYCTDVSRVPDASRPLLEGLDVLVLDALRHEPHPTHLSPERSPRG